MAIEFVCPACGGALQVGDETAGRVIRCGGCMSALRVPDPAPAPAPTGPFETEPPPPRERRAPADPPPDDAVLPTAQRVDSQPPRAPGDRPRRTRRRRSPPASRGVLTWLIVLGSLGLFGLFACCGGFVLLMPKAKWEPHESEKGGFRAQFPAPIKPDAEKEAHLELEPGEKSEGANLFLTGQYIVIYRDIPSTKERAAKNETDEQEIEATLDKLLQAPGTVKWRNEPKTVGGFPAREVEFYCDGGWYTVRVIVADTRVYSLIAHTVTRHAGPNIRKFIDSFEITDEKLVKAGQEREAERGRAKAREDKRRAEEEGEQKRRADATRLRHEQEATEAEGSDLRRAARAVTELSLSAATAP